MSDLTTTFPTLLILGVAAAFAWVLLAATPSQPGQNRPETHRIQRIDGMLAGLAAGLLLARLAYVLLHASAFDGQLEEALAIWRGGLTGWGGMVGALIGLWLYAWMARVDFWRLADRLAVPAALIAFSGWIGCMGDGCAYGRMADGSWLALSGPDWTGVVRRRWPTQALGALSAVAAVGCGYLGRASVRRAGLAASAAFSFLAAGGLAASLLRADPTPSFAGVRYDLIANGLLLFGGLGVTLWRLYAREDET